MPHKVLALSLLAALTLSACGGDDSNAGATSATAATSAATSPGGAPTTTAVPVPASAAGVASSSAPTTASSASSSPSTARPVETTAAAGPPGQATCTAIMNVLAPLGADPTTLTVHRVLPDQFEVGVPDLARGVGCFAYGTDSSTWDTLVLQYRDAPVGYDRVTQALASGATPIDLPDGTAWSRVEGDRIEVVLRHQGRHVGVYARGSAVGVDAVVAVSRQLDAMALDLPPAAADDGPAVTTSTAAG